MMGAAVSLAALAVQLFLLLAIPWGLKRMARRWKLIQWLSPVFFCYVTGIVWGNLPMGRPDAGLIHLVVQLCVPLAIPILLFPTHIPSWLRMAPGVLLSFALWVVALCSSAALALLFFKPYLGEAEKLAGMLIGVYTGGTPNMAAVHRALGVAEDTFVLMNFTDLLLSGTFLVMVLSFLFPVYRLLLGRPGQRNARSAATAATTEEGPFSLSSALVVLLAGLLVMGLAVVLSLLLWQELNEMAIIMLVSVGGLLASRVSRIRHQPMNYPLGQYIIMVFCIAVGALVDLQAFFTQTSLLMAFMAAVFAATVCLHLLCCRLFQVGPEIALITAVAGIFGPPFVGPVAEAIGHREVIPTGISLGVLGFALGNFLGIGFSSLLISFSF
ncbi:MAG: DUF819 family protein [Bacteroidetes bacterium]|nr:MAG: DUF819 family protein [Bacteroidota bacterium]